MIDSATVAYRGNQSDDAAVGTFLAELRREAERTGAGILLIAHSNRLPHRTAANDANDVDLVAGSTAWTDRVRGVLNIARDDDGLALVVAKSNYGERGLSCDLTAIHDPQGRPIRYAGARWRRPS